MEQSQKQTCRGEPKPIAPEWLERWAKANIRLRKENERLREACKFALEEWFNRVYPPDIFIGGPSSDPGVNEVREVANKLRAALERDYNGSLPATDG